MKKYTKILVMGVLFIMSLGLLVGCGGSKYNAVVYDKAIEWMAVDYIEENTTRNSTILESELAPETITHIITTQSEFDKVFTKFSPEVDFEKEILVLYFFTDIYNGFDCIIEKIVFTDGELDLTILHKMAKKNIWGNRKPSVSVPTQRCIVIKIDKLNVTTTNIEMIYK